MPLVTPGLLPVFVHAFPTIALINVDLPTLGIPTTIQRTGRFFIPLRLSLSIFSLHASRIIGLTLRIPVPFFALILSTMKPLSVKYLTHSSLTLSDAKSHLLRSIILDLLTARESISGLRLLKGILASTISITRSISLIFSSIILFALVI